MSASLKRFLPIGLLLLLIAHTLAYVLVVVTTWWQAEHALSERLLIFRSVDSLTEFQLPMRSQREGTLMAHNTEAGFRYHGHDYTVVSMELRRDTLHIMGLEITDQSIWADDLLAFVSNHLTGNTMSGQKANQLLKFLLTEYSLSPRPTFQFGTPVFRPAVRIPYLSPGHMACLLPVHSPPPEAPAWRLVALTALCCA